MSGHPQSKYASLVLIVIALGIGFVSQGRGTMVNALGASLGLVLASILLASITVGLVWVASLLISRKSFPAYIWANAVAVLSLVVTLLFVVFGSSLKNFIDRKHATAWSSQGIAASAPSESFVPHSRANLGDPPAATTPSPSELEAQTLKNDRVLVEVTDYGATSELLDVPLTTSPRISHASLGVKYFGPNSESDLSVVLTLHGEESRYPDGVSFGAHYYAGNTPVSRKYRVAERITRDGDKTYLVFRMTETELAWLAAESSLKIDIYDVDAEEKYDSFSLTAGGMSSFKSFAESVLLIRSHLN